MKFNAWFAFTFSVLNVCSFSPAFTQLQVAGIFSSHMVLQRNKPLPVWGTATPGNKVQVSFAGVVGNTTADNTGKWQVELAALKQNGQPQTLEVSSNQEKIILEDVLVGDVWLCSGQSNMEYPLDRKLKKYKAPGRGNDLADEAVQNKAGRPDAIRYIYVERNLNKYPALPANGWVKGSDTLINYASAIGFFFAMEVFEQTKVPIGIITAAWGGTRIEQWTQPAAYKPSPVFGQVAASSDTFKIDGLKPGQMYRGMIEPMIPFAIKGVLWYQGESNCMIEDQDTYVEKMKVMEDSWRKNFRNQQLPFYTVQIAPFLYSTRKDPKPHTTELLAGFWEAQANCTKLPRTYMVVTTDLVDNLKDIHPSYKWVIAHRMAQQALAYDYGIRNSKANSPEFARVKRKRNQLIVSFKNKGGGLQSSDGKDLSWFSVAGDDGKFVAATAILKKNKIIVSSADTGNPKYVRFAWHESAMPNLATKEGLPCIPFRTDRL